MQVLPTEQQTALQSGNSVINVVVAVDAAVVVLVTVDGFVSAIDVVVTPTPGIVAFACGNVLSGTVAIVCVTGKVTGATVTGAVTESSGEQRQAPSIARRAQEMETGSTAEGTHVTEDTRVPAVSDEQ